MSVEMTTKTSIIIQQRRQQQIQHTIAKHKDACGVAVLFAWLDDKFHLAYELMDLRTSNIQWCRCHKI